MKTFILSEADIQSIINGRDVIKKDGDNNILIRQSYVKDLAAPMIKDKFEVHDAETEEFLKNVRLDSFPPNFFQGGQA